MQEVLNKALTTILRKQIEVMGCGRTDSGVHASHFIAHFDTDEEIKNYRNTLLKNIKRNTALCVKSKDDIVGFLIYSLSSNCLGCMAVHPDHRRNGIGSLMIDKMLNHFPVNSTITVSTFRENDSLGVAPRALYRKLGFIESELTVEFGYPHQKFYLIK